MACITRTLLVTTAVALATWPGSAAQALQISAAERPESNRALPVANAAAGDDIVVTARRREEMLQDVPVAIIAVTGEALKQGSIAKLEDLQRLAASFNVQPSAFGGGALTVTLRSQRQALPNITYDQSVAIYLAEVVQARSQGLNTALYDLSSVQILKGPQGTLFGRNSTGGALIITPRAPDNTLGGYVQGTLGNYDLRQVEGALNLPIHETLQIRLAGRLNRRDGYTRSLSTGFRLDGERAESGRISIKFQPVQDLTNTLVLNLTHQNDSANEGHKLIFAYPGSPAVNNFGIDRELADLQNRDFHTTYSNAPKNTTRVKSLSLSNITEFNIGTVTLKNIFGFVRVKSFLYFDLDGSSRDIIFGTEDFSSRQYSNELQLAGEADEGRLKYILGAYIFHEKGDDHQRTPTLGSLSENQGYAVNKSRSLFAQATYDLPFLTGASLTVGGRKTWDDRSLRLRRFRAGNCAILTANVGGVPISPCEKQVEASFDKFTYNLTADWKVNNDTLLYLTKSRGYRSGGFTISAALPSEFAPFRPELVDNYEFGLKSDWQALGTRFRTNIAVYQQDYTDIQRNLTFFSGVNVQSAVINAASAKINGFEIEQTWWPAKKLQLNVSWAYSDPQYKKFIVNTAAGPRDYRQAPFAGAPRHMVVGLARWEFDGSDPAFGSYAVQVNGSYRSSSVTADVNSFNPITQKVNQQQVLSGYKTFDARLDWNNALGRAIDLSLFVRNFTDEEYYVAGLDLAPVGTNVRLLGPPRNFGVEARFTF